MQRMLWVVATTVVMLALVILVCMLQRFILFPAPTRAGMPSVPNGELIEIEQVGRKARGFLIRSRSDSDRLLVIFHGNGATMDGDVDLGLYFARAGLHVLLVEYPGYGLSSDSRPSESRIYSDAALLIQYAQQTLAVDAQQTVAFGHSLGSAVAVEMAERGLVSRLALISPFTSVPDLAALHFLPPGLKWLSRAVVCDRFDSAARARSLKLPVLVVHGQQDSLVPFHMGKELHSAFAQSEFIAVDASHNDVLMRMSADDWQRLRDFMLR